MENYITEIIGGGSGGFIIILLLYLHKSGIINFGGKKTGGTAITNITNISNLEKEVAVLKQQVLNIEKKLEQYLADGRLESAAEIKLEMYKQIDGLKTELTNTFSDFLGRLSSK